MRPLRKTVEQREEDLQKEVKLNPKHNIIQHARLISVISTKSPYFYTKYKLKSKFEDRETNTQWSTVIDSIFEKVITNMVESTSGVYMEGFGYFGVIKYPTINEDSFNIAEMLKMKDGGLALKPLFIGMRTGIFDAFNVEFKSSVLKRIYEKAYEDHRYKLAYTIARSKYKNMNHT